MPYTVYSIRSPSTPDVFIEYTTNPLDYVLQKAINRYNKTPNRCRPADILKHGDAYIIVIENVENEIIARLRVRKLSNATPNCLNYRQKMENRAKYRKPR